MLRSFFIESKEAWKRLLSDGKMKPHMAKIKAVTTTEKILEELNGKDKKLPWVKVKDIYSHRAIEIEKDGSIKNTSRGVPSKIFVNMETGEIKTYAIKLIDTPEAEGIA
ncbi:hypothetical protein LCGC14_0963740 [marine sediment metagenome]|uniref:Uncharacterized protein n=1 Tax=marine sediment metagenome TaxID=412755 RepID=A0A0F9QWX4_9ZZZZ|nr:hypothetical protein [Candidatus Aminicenantes bacterium]